MNSIKTYLAILLVGTTCSLFGQSKTQKISANIGGGYVNNVFLAPRSYLSGGDTLGEDSLYVSGVTYNTDINYQLNRVFNKKNELTFYGNLETSNYIDPDLKSFYGLIGQGKLVYQHNFKKYTYVQLKYQGRRKRTIRTTITGDEYVRPYSYWSNYPSINYQKRLFKNAYWNVDGGYDMRVYDGNDSIQNFQSLSYNSINFGTTLKYKHKLFKKLILYQLSYDRRLRNFTEWTIDGVFDENGIETTLGDLLEMDASYVAPLRRWYYTYLDFEVKYLWSKKMSSVFNIGQFVKDDVEGGDIGFTTPYIGGEVRYKTKKHVLTLEYHQSTRYYHNRFAYVADGEDPSFLTYHFQNVDLSYTRQWKSGLGAFASLSTENRISNSTDLKKKFRRSYFTYSVQAGITYEAKRKKKIKKK